MYLLYVCVPNLVLKIFSSTKCFSVKFENMWGKISIIFNEQLLILRIVNYMHSNKFILWRILIKLSKIFISIIYFILQKKEKKLISEYQFHFKIPKFGRLSDLSFVWKGTYQRYISRKAATWNNWIEISLWWITGNLFHQIICWTIFCFYIWFPALLNIMI